MRQFQHGTTTLAFVYAPKTTNDKGGIIVAVDSRASAGQYICKYRERTNHNNNLLFPTFFSVKNSDENYQRH